MAGRGSAGKRELTIFGGPHSADDSAVAQVAYAKNCGGKNRRKKSVRTFNLRRPLRGRGFGEESEECRPSGGHRGGGSQV